MRRIIAVVCGVITMLIIGYLSNRVIELSNLSIRLIIVTITSLTGGLVVGFIVKQKGWLNALLSGIVILIMALLLDITATIVLTLSSSYSPKILLETWTDAVIPIACMLSFCMLGGHLGQLLAQIWHKRPQRK